jgi:hypothetical protein
LESLVEFWTECATAVNAYCKGLAGFGGGKEVFSEADNTLDSQYTLFTLTGYNRKFEYHLGPGPLPHPENPNFEGLKYVHRTVGEFFAKSAAQQQLIGNAFLNEDAVRISSCKGQIYLLGALIAAWNCTEGEPALTTSICSQVLPLVVMDVLRRIYLVQDDNGASVLWDNLHSTLRRYVGRSGKSVLDVLWISRLPDEEYRLEEHRRYEDTSWDLMGLALFRHIPLPLLERLLRISNFNLRIEKNHIPHLLIHVASELEPSQIVGDLNSCVSRINALYLKARFMLMEKKQYQAKLDRLLEYGADPNHVFGDTTPWKYLLSRIFQTLFMCRVFFYCPELKSFLRDRLEAFLQRKADLDVMCNFYTTYHSQCGPEIGLGVVPQPYLDMMRSHPPGAKLTVDPKLTVDNADIRKPVSLSARYILTFFREAGLEINHSLFSPDDEDVYCGNQNVFDDLKAEIWEEVKKQGYSTLEKWPLAV